MLAANQLSIYGAVAHWCNNQCGQATDIPAEEQLKDVLPDLVTDFTKFMLGRSKHVETWYNFCGFGTPSR